MVFGRLTWLFLVAAGTRCGSGAETSCLDGAVAGCAAQVAAEDEDPSALIQVATPAERRAVTEPPTTTTGDDSSYCLGKIHDVPMYIIQLYNKCKEKYPTVPAVKRFDMAAFVGRFFVAATSEASKAVAYQCRCPAIDVGYAGPSGYCQRWNWQVTMRPDDEDKNRHVINPLLQYYEWKDKRKPQIFKDPLDGNAPAKDYRPDPIYTCVVVKTGPIMESLGGYLYYLLSCEKLKGDTGLPFLPKKGTFTFEVYTRDLDAFYRGGYYEDVQKFIAEQTKGNKCVAAALKLVKQNHTGCTYPYKPAYTETTKAAAAKYQMKYKVLK